MIKVKAKNIFFINFILQKHRKDTNLETVFTTVKVFVSPSFVVKHYSKIKFIIREKQGIENLQHRNCKPVFFVNIFMNFDITVV